MSGPTTVLPCGCIGEIEEPGGAFSRLVICDRHHDEEMQDAYDRWVEMGRPEPDYSAQEEMEKCQ